jgi:TRAP-type mannitol/chloroaromatic compound transport system permease small subunit
MNIESKKQAKISLLLDNIITRLGNLAAWMNVLLIAAIIVQVVLRYLFGLGLVMLEEIQWHLFSAAFMIGLSYCIVSDDHIRLDLLHAGFSERTKEKIEIFGTLFLLLPMTIVILMHGFDFWWDSWRIGESSDAPLGLCCRWGIKAILPLSFVLLLLAALSRLIRAVSVLRVPGSRD